jgi:RNA polymerase sigma-70 factor, ECF subfamily
VQPDTDEQLLEGVRAGETASFAALYMRYRSPLFSFCLRLTAERAAAEDAVHETFLKLSATAETIRNGGALRTWLFRVARNEALMMLRSGKRLLPVDDSDADDPMDPDTPLTLLESKDGAAMVEHAILRLKPEYREAILLREFEDLSYAAIAEITGATEATVKTRLFRARKSLGETLHLFTDGRRMP